MAESLFRRAASVVAGADDYDIASAGTDPVGSLEGVAEVLREIGIGGPAPERRALDTALAPRPDLLIILCEEGCGSCPYLPGARRSMRWPLPDPDQLPAGERVALLRRIRDDLGLRIATLINLPPI